MGIVILIIILGVGVGFITFFVVRSVLAPKRVASIANLVKQGKHAHAIRLSKAILAKDPRNADAHYLLGLAYLGENKAELALMEFKTVNQIGQFEGFVREVPFRQKIAELFTKFNQPEEALKEYLLLIKQDPGNPDYYYQAGRLFEDRDRSSKAAALYKKAVELDGKHSKALSGLGSLLFRAKQYAEAKGYLDSAVRLDPENYRAWFYIAKIHKEFRDHTAAMSAFEKATKDPELKMRALVERGGSLLALGDYDRAAAELERAVKNAEDESANETLFARYFLAAAYEKTRRLEPAIEQWEKIYQKKPGFRDVAEKLTQFQEMRHDDRIKDYLTSNIEEFASMCRKLTTEMGYSVRDITPIEHGCEIIAVEPQSKWRNTRNLPTVIRFFRGTETVDEGTVRALHEAMKKQNVNRGMLVCSSIFSRSAVEFVESRPIDLLNKEKLQELLNKISL